MCSEESCFDFAKQYLLDTRDGLCLKACFGMSQQDISEVRALFDSAMFSDENDKGETHFPDFVGTNGFIEHFEVSIAGESNRKGSVDRQFAAESKRMSDNKMAEMMNESGFCADSIVRKMPKSSYDYFVGSFRRNFEKHICHLRKYTGTKDVGVFMVDARRCFFVANV